MFSVQTGETATVYLVADIPASASPCSAVVRYLDERRIRVVRSCHGMPGCTEDSVRDTMRSCSTAVVLANAGETEFSPYASRDLRIAAEQELPLAHLNPANPVNRDLEHLVDRICCSEPKPQPYAFLAVRIHDDFALVRAAICSAVEKTLGVACIWFDDPRVVTNLVSVRQRTKASIREASLVIADLTFGPNNPGQDSPNTAHEIGMAVAYERPLIVTCQEPRRDLYFLAGDLHVLFWHDEEHLHHQITGWLHSRRGDLGRHVLNYDCTSDDYAANIAAPHFRMDRARRYVAPNKSSS